MYFDFGAYLFRKTQPIYLEVILALKFVLSKTRFLRPFIKLRGHLLTFKQIGLKQPKGEFAFPNLNGKCHTTGLSDMLVHMANLGTCNRTLYVPLSFLMLHSSKSQLSEVVNS